MNIPVLTIDGPSGAGKGTVSRAVAKQLGWHYLDSGSIYRSLAIALLQKNVPLTNIAEIIKTADNMDLAFDCTDELIVKLSGEDISRQLGLETTGSVASQIAAIPEVRAALLQKQKQFKQLPGLVADGRDMGTVVFPEAIVKVFLTASAEERARRRHKQLMEKGIDANLAQITSEIEERDLRDMQRTSAPLMVAEGAVYIDSSSIPISSVIHEVISLIR